jgi:arylsulfatase A-like enzyme
MFGHRTARRRFLGLAGSAMLASTMLTFPVAAETRAAPRRPQPNIVFIMVDDIGYADLSSYGAQGYATPALDELASQGQRFDNAYASSAICSPTRVSVLTGKYPGAFRAGVNEPNVAFQSGQEIPLNTPTVASVLKNEGYNISFIGKWHVAKVPEFSPLRYGYDYFFGIRGGAADYFLHSSISMKNDPAESLRENDEIVEREGYLTDILTDTAIAQIRELTADQAKKPSFMSLHYNAPHWPWEGPEDGARADRLTDMRDWDGGSLETYATMMRNLDSNVGRVMAALKDLGIEDNTMVVFTNDNRGERFSNTWPLVGYKGELFEGGICVPLIVRWPGHVSAGSVNHQIITSVDILPTFVAAAGGAVPPRLDGMSLLAQIEGQAPPIERTVYWRMNADDQAAVRRGDWKYLRVGGKEHLHNLRVDPRERVQRKDAHPELFEELRDSWTAWSQTQIPYDDGSFSESNSLRYPDRFGAPAK